MCLVPKLTILQRTRQTTFSAFPSPPQTLVAIVINTMIITTIATSWRKNWEGQAGKGKFQEATHNNLGGFLKYRTQGLIAAKENPSTVPIRL